jgi:hypothetical protein
MPHSIGSTERSLGPHEALLHFLNTPALTREASAPGCELDYQGHGRTLTARIFCRSLTRSEDERLRCLLQSRADSAWLPISVEENQPKAG